MGINGDNINIFEYTKIFKEEINKFSQNMPGLKDKINNCIIDFTKNKFKSLYYRKPLKNGEFKKYNLHELELGGDYRIIIQIVGNTCYFLNFGTHSSLNLSSNKKLKINPLK